MRDQRQPGARDVNFARSPIGGKKTATIKFRCAPELKDDTDRLAHEMGFASSNEFCELLLAVTVLGEEHCRSVADHRLRKVASLFPAAIPPAQAAAPTAPVDIGALLVNLGQQLQKIGAGR